MPTTHECRSVATSYHFIGDGTDVSQLCLKVAPFESPAALSIISDMDLVEVRREDCGGESFKEPGRTGGGIPYTAAKKTPQSLLFFGSTFQFFQLREIDL